ncbi:MAG: hypothetical protein ACSHWZ_15055 [Sulfitobacter sp.]
MKEIEELQRRITAAMDQVAYGLDQLSSRVEPDPEVQKELDEERIANAQLKERVQTLRDKLTNQTTTMRAALDESEARVAALDLELQRVRGANGELAAACAALREANAEGVGDAHLINKTMLTELEALRALRAADAAEASAIVDSLTPLVEAAEQNSDQKPEQKQEDN